MKSLLTRILLGACALLALLAVFLPYAQIPSVDAIKEFDTNKSTITIDIGKEITTYNFSSAIMAGSVYTVFEDKACTKKLDPAKLPLEVGDNTFYMQINALGTLKDSANTIPGKLIIDTVTLTINRGASGETVTAFDEKTNTIAITVSRADAKFDFTKIISNTKGWNVFKNPKATIKLDADNVAPKSGKNVFYAGVTLPGAKADTYLPIKLYTLTINRDALKETSPIVSEFGHMYSVKSAGEKYDGDNMLFIAMAVSIIVLLGSFLVPSKFRIIQLVISVLFGVFLIAIPVMEMSLLTAKQYVLSYGLFVTIGIGVLLLVIAVLNFIAERKQYKIDKALLDDVKKAV